MCVCVGGGGGALIELQSPALHTSSRVISIVIVSLRASKVPIDGPRKSPGSSLLVDTLSLINVHLL